MFTLSISLLWCRCVPSGGPQTPCLALSAAEVERSLCIEKEEDAATGHSRWHNPPSLVVYDPNLKVILGPHGATRFVGMQHARPTGEVGDPNLTR